MNDKKVTKTNSNDPTKVNDKVSKEASSSASPSSQAKDSVKQTVKPAEQTKAKSEPVRRPSFDAEFEKVKKKNERRPGRGLSWFAILLSLAALGGSGFTWYTTQIQEQQKGSQISQDVTDVNVRVSALNKSLTSLQESQSEVASKADISSSVQEVQANLAKQLRPMQASQKALGGAFSKIKGDLAMGSDKFLLDEVAQMLRLANSKVLFESDAESAINALKFADDQLKTIGDPKYAGVRGKINEEIASLNTVKTTDVNGLSGRLRGIAALVASLPLANEPDEKKVEIVAAPIGQELTWRTELKKVWRDLLSSVQVRRVDQPAKPLLVPEQRYFLIQNLKLTLNKAELALLKGQDGVFETSVKDAATWLRDYFEVSDERVSKVISQLEDISTQNIKSELPEITGSYQALQSVRGS